MGIEQTIEYKIHIAKYDCVKRTGRDPEYLVIHPDDLYQTFCEINPIKGGPTKEDIEKSTNIILMGLNVLRSRDLKRGKIRTC